MKKKHILATVGTLVLGMVLGFGVYVNAQTGGGLSAQLFGRDALVEADREFQYKDDLALNPGGAELESGKITGKITGDRLTAKEFNRLLELASNGGSGMGGVSCGSGEVMVGIGEGGEPSCVQIFTQTVADEGLYFGGMYGYGASGLLYGNPLAGNTAGCPAGYTAQQVTGAGGWPGDQNAFFCYANPGEAAQVAHFGGMYGIRATGNGYVVNQFTNPIADDAYGCPAGYSSSKVLGLGTFDRDLFFCYSTDLATEKLESFQGMYSPSIALYINPKTGGLSCPAGAQTAQVWGSQFDKDVFICYGDVAGGGNTTTIIGGGTGGGTPLTFANFDGTSCTGAGNECLISKSNNVEKVVRNEEGRYTIYFENNFSDNKYVVFGTASMDINGVKNNRGSSVELETRTAASVDKVNIETTRIDSANGVPYDSAVVHVLVYDGSSIGGIGSGTAGTVDLITPNYTTGYTSYTGDVDASGYDFIEFGGFDGGSGEIWGARGRGTASTITPVGANGKAAINVSSDGQDANITLSFDADSKMSFSFANMGGGQAKLAFVRGINIGAGGSGGTGTGTGSMKPGWPDAIKCSVTGPQNWGQEVFFSLIAGDYEPSDRVIYRVAHTSRYVDVVFNSDKTYNSSGFKDSDGSGPSLTTDCAGKSILDLYAEGKAFNFGGNSVSGGGNTGGSGAWFTWSRSEGILKSSGIEKIDLVSNRPQVTLSTPMSSDKYAVICNGTMGQGAEEQVFAYSKTANDFTVRGAHAGGEDPINFLDCIVTENGFGGATSAGTGTGSVGECRICQKPEGRSEQCTDWVNLAGGDSRSAEFTDHGDTGKTANMRLECRNGGGGTSGGPKDVACPEGKFVTGFDSSGDIICSGVISCIDARNVVLDYGTYGYGATRTLNIPNHLQGTDYELQFWCKEAGIRRVSDGVSLCYSANNSTGNYPGGERGPVGSGSQQIIAPWYDTNAPYSFNIRVIDAGDSDDRGGLWVVAIPSGCSAR